MTDVAFSAPMMERFQKTVALYETPQCALLPTLYLAQEQFAVLTPPILEYVAKLLGMAPAQVVEAATFYTLFRKKDRGKYCLQICNNITCTMMGSEELLNIAKEELGIGPEELTEDRRFSVMVVQCLGSCGTAPVVQVNDAYHENMDPEKFRKTLREWKAGQEPRGEV